ncbi:MAG TPA: M90 family metallopeptidase [Steroidobacteraceae bacterium]|nr:M90 family metallopeptidase [Steroidobacteraceae bacterium]
MIAFALACALATGIIVAIVVAPLRRRRRRQRLAKAPLPVAVGHLLERTRTWRRLPDALRPRLAARVQIFLAEHEFVGCGGLTVSDAIRVGIAAQACLLMLNRTEHGFDELRSILVYPDEFVVTEDSEADGVVTERRRALSGQSWDTSRIVLSWRDVEGAGDGYNVVIHEFAHYLDQEAGAPNGAPLLADADDYNRWAAVMSRAYRELATKAEAGAETLLDPYALEDEAEFFAVATETFFELPRELAHQQSELYAELARFYRLDPATW